MKEYVDWEIEAIVEKLTANAFDKGEKYNDRRRDFGYEPIPTAHELSADWMAIQVIRQLQEQVKAAVALQAKPEPMVMPKMPPIQTVIPKYPKRNKNSPPQRKIPPDERPADINNIPMPLDNLIDKLSKQ